jgi:hypothetical protein
MTARTTRRRPIAAATFGAAALGLIAATLPAAPARALDTPIGQLDQYRDITISGTVSGVWGNDFVLEDPSGKVLVHAGPHWYHDVGVKEGDRLTVTGRVDGPNFEARTITWDDGRSFTVRPADGPPPWGGKEREKAERDRDHGPRHDRAHDGPGPRPVAELDLRVLGERLAAAGYTRITDVDLERRHISAEAVSRDGLQVELHIDPRGYDIIRERRDEDDRRPDIALDLPALAGMLSDRGYATITDVSIDDGLIEVDAVARGNQRVELEIDPETLNILRERRDD